MSSIMMNDQAQTQVDKSQVRYSYVYTVEADPTIRLVIQFHDVEEQLTLIYASEEIRDADKARLEKAQ